MKKKIMSSSTGATSFRKYCESTSLHGWQYIYYSSQKGWRMMWIGMTLSSVIIAFCFVYKQTYEFTKATVVTTVDTTTAPLSDVYFPAVTICNINQVTNRCVMYIPHITVIMGNAFFGYSALLALLDH